MKWILLILVSIISVGLLVNMTQKRQKSSLGKNIEPPIIIAHRGASGYRPEHTLEAYQLAIDQGADFIEPDLVITKDKVLIARHENEISGTTDVRDKFPGRETTKFIDGRSVTGWFAEDFTLDEIKTLRAKERLNTREQSFNGCCEIPTLAEVIELARKNSQKIGRQISIYPETKHPSFFSSINLALEPILIEELKKTAWTDRNAPVIVQSFEIQSLRRVREQTDVRLVLLFHEHSKLLERNQLKKLSELLYGIGPNKEILLKYPEIIKDAHAVGLKVHAYTFRSDPPFLDTSYRGEPEKEYLRFFKLGIDGMFTDFPDHAFQARRKMYF